MDNPTATERQCIPDTWYCARTIAGREPRLVEALNRLNIETYLPLLSRPKTRTVTRFIKSTSRYKAIQEHYFGKTALFPGYLFAKLDGYGWAATKTRLGVTHRPRWIDFGSGPIGLTSSELAETIEAATAPKPTLETQTFKSGQFVEVLEGPFAGFTGTASYSADERVFILLRMLGREPLVRFASSEIAPLSSVAY